MYIYIYIYITYVHTSNTCIIAIIIIIIKLFPRELGAQETSASRTLPEPGSAPPESKQTLYLLGFCWRSNPWTWEVVDRHVPVLLAKRPWTSRSPPPRARALGRSTCPWSPRAHSSPRPAAAVFARTSTTFIRIVRFQSLDFKKETLDVVLISEACHSHFRTSGVTTCLTLLV